MTALELLGVVMDDIALVIDLIGVVAIIWIPSLCNERTALAFLYVVNPFGPGGRSSCE